MDGGEEIPLRKTPPHELTYLMEYFLELNETRGSNGFGPNPITYGEVEAWSRLTGIGLQTWEVAVLRQLDREYFGAWNNARASRTHTPNREHRGRARR